MPIVTPDGRYIIVRERLWRAANPGLEDDEREALTRDLMAARRAVAAAMRNGDEEALKRARRHVHTAKLSLGERGPVWWNDGAPDWNRRLVRNTPYATWWERIQRYRQTILTLLSERAPGKSICPSDVARREENQWRNALDDVRTAARSLAEEGLLRVTQKDRDLSAGDVWVGAIRLRLPADNPKHRPPA